MNYKGLIDILNLHGTDRVKYTNGMIDMEEFATFSVKTKIYSDRTPTHRGPNKAIANIIMKYKGDYEKMYNKNIMGIASGTEYSQFIAKQIITSESIQDTLKFTDNLSRKRASLITILEGYQNEYKQTIHETNLETRKRKNTTQWVPSDINNKLRHLGGTSDQGKVEKMQQKACSKGK